MPVTVCWPLTTQRYVPAFGISVIDVSAGGGNTVGGATGHNSGGGTSLGSCVGGGPPSFTTGSGFGGTGFWFAGGAGTGTFGIPYVRSVATVLTLAPFCAAPFAHPDG